ncbi:LysR substrate-binding domain-containing protein [Paraburkholderia pallida]|uniref:LysR family transcriptional regulator n=1 Tax=Paraburkholderia pallida TaxID=2547399 RepID=A0A4P7D5K3_9BURK|nr:LysR substrate-binding domain-containing protein [Paraburkholderia pallida]QBR02200.1 LysR family transcriptional regulator [Paraburkholderia pallida]
MARPLNFRHVETIYAVLLTGSVTGGAARLHVTQPAVSNLLKEAEERLGFPLFERHAGRLVPTQKAELIFEEIERSFTGLDAVNSFCARLAKQETRKVVIGATPAFATAVLPIAIRAYRETVDDVHFSVVSRRSDHVQALVASQKVDIGFGLEEPAIPGVSSTLLTSERMVCVLPAGHPLASKSVISAGDLCGEPMISLSHVERIDDIVEAAFADVGGSPPAVAECPAALTALAMVEAGIGFAIVGPFSAWLFRHGTVACRPFEPVTKLNFSTFTVPGRKENIDQAAFLKLVDDAVKQVHATMTLSQ